MFIDRLNVVRAALGWAPLDGGGGRLHPQFDLIERTLKIKTREIIRPPLQGLRPVAQRENVGARLARIEMFLENRHAIGTPVVALPAPAVDNGAPFCFWLGAGMARPAR